MEEFSMKKKRIAIAEDHQLFRDGLKSMINAEDDIEVAGEAKDGIEALHRGPDQPNNS